MATGHTADVRPAVDAALVGRLVGSQFPRWAGLPLEPLLPGGSDHVIYRLGTELTVRLPRHAGALGQAAKESVWLPRLAPHLPLAVPVPVAVGEPAFGYPWPWAVSRWLDGEVATVDALGDSSAAAVELAEFLIALWGYDPGAVPADLAGAGLSAGSLADRDRDTRAAVARIAREGGPFDPAAMTELWDAALAAPAWPGPPVWFHGDFHTGNVLMSRGCPGAVIDFGDLGVGDPARDLIIAFTLMSATSRAAFRTALGVDDATWTRGRGWALATGLNAYNAYAAGNPRVAAQTTRQITRALTG